METLLLVDDNEINRRVLREMLELGGHQIVEARNGHEAIELFQQREPSLVLMDIMMPGMDGQETTRRIKTLAGDQHTPVIYVTAKSTEALPTALAAGGDDYITKPVDFKLLQAKIRAHLRVQRLNRQLSQQQQLMAHFFDAALQQSYLEPGVIRHHMASASAFNGDILLAERGPHGGLYVLLGDFTGHGLSAAMGTLPAAQVFFAMTRKGTCVAELAREINRQLHSLLPPGMFLAATLLELSPAGTHVNLWSGGMPRIWWLDQQCRLKSPLPSFHMPLGILSEDEFDPSVQAYAVSPGDRLYLHSDGLTEAINENGEIFGESRLEYILTSPTDDPFQALLQTLDDFRGQQPQRDDISLVEIRCQAIAPAEPACHDTGDEHEVLPWQLRLELDSDQIRRFEPVTLIGELFTGHKCLARRGNLIQTVLAEIYHHLLEHGLLGLDARMKNDETRFVAYYRQREKALAQLRDAHMEIRLALDNDADGKCLRIRMRHDGPAASPLPPISAEYPTGLGLAAALCDSLRLHDDGRAIEACFRL